MQLITCQGGALRRIGEALPPAADKRFATGLPELDELLPGGAFTRGAVHEILSEPAHGLPLSFALLIGRSAASGAGAIVWCDPQRRLYPPALAAAGVELGRLYLLRPKSPADEVWAVAESLRCKGVRATIAAPQRLSRVEARRLQLAAERGGGTGVLLRSLVALHAPYAAATRWLIAPAPGDRAAQRWSVQLLHGHGGHIGQSVLLEINRETNSLRAAAPMAHRPPAPLQAVG